MHNRLDAGTTRQISTPWWTDSQGSENAPPPAAREMLAAYLAQVRCHLMGLSEAEVNAVCDELRQHLLASAHGYEELGEDSETALRSALAVLGASQSVGANFSRTYQSTGSSKNTFPLATILISVRQFIVAVLAALALVYVAIAVMNWLPENIGRTVANLCDVLVSVAVLLIIPAFVGWHLGRSHRVRPVSGVFFALMALVILSCPLFVANLLTTERYNVWRDIASSIPAALILWMPVAVAAAYCARSVTDRQARGLRPVQRSM